MKKMTYLFMVGAICFYGFSAAYSRECSRPNITGSCIPKKYKCGKTTKDCCFHGLYRMWIGENGKMQAQTQTQGVGGFGVVDMAIKPMPFCSN